MGGVCVSRRIDYTVPPEYDGCKLQRILRGGVGCSYALVRSLKTKEDGILLNSVRARTIDRAHTGDQISITLHEQQPQQFSRCEIAVEILYEDTDLIVYNKPAGMPCHPVRNLREDTLANVFATHCTGDGEPLTCRILNRLDRDTTGAVLIAKNSFAAAALTGRVEKSYLALAGGTEFLQEGTIDAPLGQPDRTNPRRAVMEGGQRALTHYQLLGTGEDYSLLRCVLETGRTHQIRVHMQYIGHPLLGDVLYQGALGRMQRQALHCNWMAFWHPVNGKRVEIKASLPQDMQKWVSQCKIHVKGA